MCKQKTQDGRNKSDPGVIPREYSGKDGEQERKKVSEAESRSSPFVLGGKRLTYICEKPQSVSGAALLQGKSAVSECAFSEAGG